ncbi:MAG: 2-phospho-L-lactate guanylyltransferase [Thermoleophilia bacterium]
MNVVAVIPVKRFGRALGRLAGVLSREERADLQAAMLTDLLEACTACPRLAGVTVVSSDPQATALAAGAGARTLPDHDPPRGMNAAVAIGRSDAAARGADAVLVLTADLPLAAPNDLAAVVDALGTAGGVLVPSRDGTGTNALLLRPPEAMGTHLGPDSRAQHHRHAGRVGLVLRDHEVPGIAVDIDTPDDLALLLAAPRSTHAQRVCRRMGLDERLAAAGAPS